MPDAIRAQNPSRDAMVESQIRTADVTELALLRAFRRTPRENFVPTAKRALAYADRTFEADEGRYMLAPRDLAKMIQAAAVTKSDIVLDLAPGRGYSTAILSQIADTVIAVETTDDAVVRATDLLVEIEVSNSAVVQGDLKSGAKEHGPFDVIFVNGAVSNVHEPWFVQLSDGGRLVCILQNGPIGQVMVYTKSGDVVSSRVAFDASAPHLPGFAPKAAFSF